MGRLVKRLSALPTVVAMWHGFYFEMEVWYWDERKKDPREDEEGNERSESARSFRVRAKSVVRLLQGYTRLKVIWDWQVTSLFL